MISDRTKMQFEREVAKYPSGQRQSAVIACLSIVQQENGYINAEHERMVAEFLGMAPMAVHEVTTFYSMFNLKPVGKYKLNVCTNLPCQLRGGVGALNHFKDKLGIALGQTTSDGLFTLQECECMGVCADAPVVLVNDRDLCSFMADEQIDQLIDGLRLVEGKS